MTTEELRRRLAGMFGASAVSTEPAVLAEHSIDKWTVSREPDVVIFAESTEQVSRLLEFATQYDIPVTPRGAGVGYVGGCVPRKGGIALSLARMTEIKEIDAADAVAVVQPGVITADLQSAVRDRGLFYPPDPASLKECSIGGNIATNAGGPRCLKYGVTRNYVLGLTVVLADGGVLKAGGRTHKNKQGFDLVGLFVGSEGLLGIVTEAILRLLPLPPGRATISASFPSLRQSAAAVQQIFASGFLPSALEITDAFTLEAARNYLGDGFVPAGNSHLLVDLDGQISSVRTESAALQSLIANMGALEIKTASGEAGCEKLWDLRRGFSYSLKATGLTKLNEDVAVPRGRLIDLADFAADLGKRYGYPVACFGHAGDGNIHVNIMADNYSDETVKKKVRDALDELFAKVLEWGGVITGEHGIGIAKERWWPAAASKTSRDVHRALKAALDPKGILNPGKFVDV
jgi:glycolate oxidase